MTLLKVSLKLLQGRVLVTVVITDTFDVYVWYIGRRLLMGSDHVDRVCNSNISHYECGGVPFCCVGDCDWESFAFVLVGV